MKYDMIWFDRKFEFVHSPDTFPAIVERLRDTTLRLRARTAGLSEAKLQNGIKGGWSVRKIIGHLGDLEPLWAGRLTDFEAANETLRAADFENKLTHESDHDSCDINSLIDRFDRLRSELVTRLETVTLEQVSQTALHPRLLQPMRLIDAFYFVAEHDDHHIAQLTSLLRE